MSSELEECVYPTLGTETRCENVKVVIRVRPLLKRDLEENQPTTVTIDPAQKVITLSKSNLNAAAGNAETTKSFKFDRIFGPDSTQLELYKYAAYPIVDKVVRGYNGTIFAYGQTGTGKTYTMMGRENRQEGKGLVPNAFAHIFGQISKYDREKSFVVTATYLEIYNEDVRDLLSYNQDVKLEVRERSDLGVYVKGLMGFTIDSIESLHELMRLGNKNRATKSTLMNRASSRSHAIFTVIIESKDRGDNRTTVGKLNLVDLAGSERLQKTRASGEQLREATNINRSLSVLGGVISALVDGKSTHVPYRNSKLTRLLQDSLGGNSKTTMIATISPSRSDFEESVWTLRYASRVKFIKNTLKVNVETKRGLIESFEEEISRLKHRISLIALREDKAGLKLSGKKSKSSLEKEKIYEEGLKKAQEEKEELEQKLTAMQKKILVGGENLLEKAQQQMFLLELSGVELENLNKSHQELEEQIQQREIEQIDVTERYSDLQEENQQLSVKIGTVQKFLDVTETEFIGKRQDYDTEIEILNENGASLEKELRLANLIIENYIPKTCAKEIEANVVWNPDIDDFHVRGPQYAGNNAAASRLNDSDDVKIATRDTRQVYRSYKRRESK
ncbi:kinesin-2B [Trypoxylus dichotomus]